jgi:hypothetical protein
LRLARKGSGARFAARCNSNRRFHQAASGSPRLPLRRIGMTFIRNPKDFWAGILYIAFGAAAIGIAINYPVGSAGRMGPGYFPRGLGILLIVLGMILVLRALRLRGAPIAFPTFKPLLVILSSVVLFGILAGPLKLGLVVATIALVIGASWASHEFTWRAALISSIVLAIFVVVAFAYGLKLQMPVWPAFLAR